MISTVKTGRLIKGNIIVFCGLLFLLLYSLTGQAQEAPPRPITIYADPAQGLNFGVFYQGGAGGTITVYPNGTRAVTGDIGELNLGVPFTPALFEVDANPGTLISVLNGSDAILSGSNGGSMTLHVGSDDVGSPFITTVIPPLRTQVRIGGTLSVGSAAANPAGNYSGTFSITFIQE